MKTVRSKLSLAISILCISGMSFAGDLQQELLANTGHSVNTKKSSTTGNTTFLSVAGSKGLSISGSTSSNAEESSRAFLKQYGSWFGIENSDSELSKLSQKDSSASRVRHAVKFQQHRDGIDILGAQIIVRLNENLEVVGVSSDASSAGVSAFSFSADKAGAENTALALVSKANADTGSSNLRSEFSRRIILNAAVLGTGVNQELAAYEIQVNNLTGGVSHVVYVDANSGAVLLDYSNIHESRNRIIYDQFNDYTLPYPNSVVARAEGAPATGVSDVDDAYDFAGDTYDFYFNEHGRDSLDDAGMDLVNVVRFCPSALSCPYGNAFWNGSFMTYGEGYATDDVVGHELAHGVTEFTSNLIYAYESGAINESLSDVWGEFIDLTNTAGNDSAAVRWKLGEDLPIGAIRDMGDPPVHGHPDKITSGNYYCGSGDNGGVHTNSGVNNKAVSLLVDGGTFNGQSVTGIGISKTADIYYQAQTNYLTAGSGWADLYNSLQSSCTDLVGVGGITSADCTQVSNALAAVEMSEGNACVVGPPVELCPAGETPNFAFSDGFESGVLDHWSVITMVGTNTWDVVATTPYSGTKHVLGGNPNSTSSSAIRHTRYIPANAKLSFDHMPNFEAGYDGGVVEYSIDGNATWSDLLAASPSVQGFGYNDTLYSGTANPLAGRDAFTNTTSYNRTIVDLSGVAGTNLMGLRFHIGTDASVGRPGWSIDDVNIYTCGAPAVSYCAGKAVTVDLSLGQVPTPGNDVILGTSADDTISGLGGDDTICGGGGFDVIYGGPGNDEIFGEGSNDTIFGGSGDDVVDGGDGVDTVYGQGGDDHVDGGAGYDYIYGGSGSDTLESGANGAYINGGGNNDVLTGSEDSDVILGSAGLDAVNGLGGADWLYGGNGADAIDGGTGNDNIFGQGHADTLLGGAGDDTIFGGTGNDSLDGGSGVDSCAGQGGNDSATACESVTGTPLTPPASLLPVSPLTDAQLLLIDSCDAEIETCLKK